MIAALLLAAVPLQGPMAVMPFKNLNADPNLDWLRAGMAETMVSDLKKSGKTAVVERAQIDKAMAEIALQVANGTEESTAARVGKMTGAKTVVLGSFQEAQKQLRINARFVAVETGEVVGAAKATGPVENVFVLQDEIIGKLLGEDSKPVAKRTRKTGAPTVKAYKLYAMAMTTASDADRVSYLREAVQIDPDFSYAQDQLAALRERLKELDAKSQRAIEKSQEGAEGVLEDPNLTPQERSQQSVMLLGKLISSYHYNRAMRFATKVLNARLAASNGMDPNEIALYDVFSCQMTLRQTDPALRTGESFLKQFPTSLYFQAVQMQMQTALDRRQAEGREVDEAKTKLAQLDKERAEAEARYGERPQILTAHLRGIDFRRCSELHQLHRYRDAIDACTQFDQKWGGHEPDPEKDLALTARHLVALSWSELGDFKKAREVVDKLIADQPEFARTRALAVIERTWPRD